MTKRILRGAASVQLLMVAIATGLSAQEPTGGPPQAVLDTYQVGNALPPLAVGETPVAMTLEEAIALAMERNLDVQTARLSPRMQAYSLASAQAAYTPTLSGTFGYNNATNQSTSQLDGGARTTTERQTFNTSLTQQVPWYGGRLSANFNNNRTTTDNRFATLNPSYSSTVSLNYTQPLLSGRTTDNVRSNIETQEILGEITQIQLTSRLFNVTDQVRALYWNLRATIEQIEIQRRALAQAQRLLADNRVRVQLGTMAQIQVIQAEAQVAGAEQSLLNAQVQWRNAELAFKSLLIDRADDPLLAQRINPIDLPTVLDQAVDIESAIDVALSERTDLRQQREQRRISELDLEVTRDSRLPDLNLTFGYSLQGVGGNLFDRSGLGGDPVLIDQGGYVAFDTNATLRESLDVVGSGAGSHRQALADAIQAEVPLDWTSIGDGMSAD